MHHHRGHELAVEPDGSHQVEGELPGPFPVAQRREAAGRGRRAAEQVNDDVDPTETLAYRGGERGAALRRCQVGGDERRLGERVRPGSRCRQDSCAEFAKQGDRGCARAACAGGDERALVFKREECGHAPISSDAI